MCSLAEGPPPPADGCITVCEENGDLVTIHARNAPVNYTPRIAGFEYPSISTSTESLCSLATDKTAQSAFQPHVDEVSLWKQAWYTCRVHGLTEMLDELSKNETAPWPVNTLACGCLTTVTMVNLFRGSLYPHLMLSPEELIHEFSAAKDWQESEIRAFAWHQHTNKCAVAWKDNTIKIFISGSDVVPTLKHRQQRGVSCLAWKPPVCNGIGCRLPWLHTHLAYRPQLIIYQANCQCSPSSFPQRSCTDNLSQLGPQRASSSFFISKRYSHTGVGCPQGSMRALEEDQWRGVALLRYSPDSSKLFASSPSQVFRVWETRTWTCEKWTQLSGRCQSACWSPDGRFLLFCTENEPAIFALNFIHSGSKTGGAESAIKCADVSELFIKDDIYGTRVGGLIQDMAWDNTGERLAVLFKSNKETGNTGELIALFNTRLTPTLQLIPSGFVRGEPGEVPELISFKPNFNHGALLTICWHSGKVTFVPLLFIPSSTLAENGRIPAHFTQKSTPLPQELFSVSKSKK